ALAERVRPEAARPECLLFPREPAFWKVESARADVRIPEFLVVALEPQVAVPPVVEADAQRAVLVAIRVLDEPTHGAVQRLCVERGILPAFVEVAEEAHTRAVVDVACAVEIEPAAFRRRHIDAEGVARLRRLRPVPRRQGHLPRLRFRV